MNWGLILGSLVGLVMSGGPRHASAFDRKFTPCEVLGSQCKCQFPDGRGLDLTSIRTNPLSWVQLKKAPEQSISVTLCGTSFKNMTYDCFGASVCLNVNDEYTNLGAMTDSKLSWESLGRTPTMTFTRMINSSYTATTSIMLMCDTNQKVPKLEFISIVRDKYNLRLTSNETCLKEYVGWSTGGGSAVGFWSVILILASVLIVLYFVGGFLVLRFIRGARGIEAIPNHNFWFKTLPDSARAAVMFLLNGCKNPDSYDRI